MTGLSKTVLITGAAGHLGRAVVAGFRERGAQLLLLDHNGHALNDIFGKDDGCVLMPVDLLNATAVKNSIEQGVADLGRIDAVCHLAGGFLMGDSVHETKEDTWNFLMDLNARSFIHVARAVIPHLLDRGGSIVTVGAGAALKGGAHMGAYSASKAALIRLTESLSAEVKSQGINVNCVLPSIIDTPDNRSAMPDANPMQWVSPEALASVLIFLVSGEARAVHGATIPVTGLV